MSTIQNLANEVRVKTLSNMVAAEIKILRKTELKLQRRARKAVSLGKVELFDNIESARNMSYKSLMDIRRESRAVNVARAYLSGKEYFEIERKVKRTNLPKDIDSFWCDVAAIVCEFSSTSTLFLYDHNSTSFVYDQLMTWRSYHPGYMAMELYMKEGGTLQQLNAILDNFGDYWLYIESPSDEEKEAA